ncbi:MAG: InlB B-repeat-containing protein [Paludibacteraceae bacterium]|nr:InlB B-repeat-containing protein [Paludibacteraceae bacterium]
MTKKIFTLLTALVLSMGIGWAKLYVRSNGQVKEPIRVTQKMEKNNDGQQATAISSESLVRSPRRLPNSRNDCGNYYANNHGGNDFSLSQISVSKVSEGRLRLHGYADVGDYEEESDIDFYVPSSCNYIPTGDYPISSSGNVYTVKGGTGLSDPYSYYAYTNWYQSRNYWYLFSATDDSYGQIVYVINPYKAEKPIFVLAIATAVSSGWQAWVTFGTEPALREFILGGETPDENGNYVEGFIDVTTDTEGADDTHFWQGTTVTIEAHPASGYVLTSFTGTGIEDIVNNNDGTYTCIIGAKNYSVTPVFEEATANYTISTAVKDDIAGCSVTGGGTYLIGSNIEIEAHAATGYVFQKWFEDNNTTNPRSISVTKDETYTAVFVPAYTITATVNDGSMGSVSGAGTFAQGANVTLTANPNADYRVQKWQKNGVDIIGETGNALNVVVNAADAYQVFFEEIPQTNVRATSITLSKQNGYFYLTGSSADGYSFRLETNSVSFPSSTTTLTAAAGKLETSSQYVYLKKNNASIALDFNKTTATFTKIDDIEWRLEAYYFGTDGTMYHITGTLFVPASGDTSAADLDFNTTNPYSKSVVQKTVSGTNMLSLEVLSTSSTPFRNLYLYFVVDNTAYNAKYIPTGTYTVGTASSVGTPRVQRSNGTYTTSGSGASMNYFPNPSSMSYKFSDGKNYQTRLYMMCRGTVEVINPNHTNFPMYVLADGYNTNNKHCKYRVYNKPSLYQVTFTADAEHGQTSSFTCAEGHGYNSTGTEITGDYFYEGTYLNLVAGAPESDEYRFDGWYNGNTRKSTNTEYKYTVGTSNNIYPKYVEVRWNINVTSNNNSYGTVTVTGDNYANGTAKHKTSVTLTAVAQPGYQFVKWSDNVTDSERTISNITADVTLQAIFEIIPHTLTMDACTGGTYAVTYGGQTQYTGSDKQEFSIGHGTQVILSAEPATGYEFLGWDNGEGGDIEFDAPRRATMEGIGGGGSIGDELETEGGEYASEENPYTFTMTEDVEYRAVFGALKYDITIAACEHGTIKVERTTDNGKAEMYNGAGGTTLSVAAGTELTLTATADEANHYEFKGWSVPEDEQQEWDAPRRAGGTEGGGEWDNLVDDNPYTFTVSSAAEYAAVFGLEQITVSVTTANPTMGSVTVLDEDENELTATSTQGNTKQYVLDYGTFVYVKAVANTGYYFTNWDDEETENPYELDVEEDIDLTASFTTNFQLVGDKYADDAWYTETYAPMKDKRISVTYVRSFVKDQWTSFSLPFNYSYMKDENQTFRGVVYELDNAVYDDGYLQLNFLRQTASIVANKPYVVHPAEEIVNPIFENVKLLDIADASYNVPCTSGHEVTYSNTQHKTTLEKGKNIIYLNQNKLYYSSTKGNTNMPAFRGFFNLNLSEEEIKHAPKIRIVVEGEEVMNLEDEAAEEFIKKYFDNEGNLIIERNGVRYDAQGKQQ